MNSSLPVDEASILGLSISSTTSVTTSQTSSTIRPISPFSSSFRIIILVDDVYTSSTRIIILKLEEKGEIGLIVDEVCEVVTLVVDEIDKPNIDASSTGKELFINGIGKNGDELISLFEIGSIVSDKDAN